MSYRIAAFMALFLGVVPVFSDEPKKDEKAFDDITPEQIAETLKKAEKTSGYKIDGSNTKANKLPNDAIVVYKTNEGRYGKFKVVEYGRDLTINWVTYEKDGAVASKGDKLTVKGTFNFDLDAGKGGNKQEKIDNEKSDFWWEQQNETTRYLVPQNQARFTVYDAKK